MMENTAFCPYCATSFKIKRDSQFEYGKPLECESCHKKFNIFQIYKSIYDKIPVGKEIADNATDMIFSRYRITGEDNADVDKISRFMKENFDDDFFRKVIRDCVVYGTCILHHKGSGENLSLSKIELPDFEIIPEVRTMGGMALNYFAGKIRNINTGEIISHDNFVVMYTQSSLTSEAVGFSIYGMWFSSWAILRIGPEAMKYQGSLGNFDKVASMENLYNYYRNQVLGSLHVVSITGGKYERETLSSHIKELFTLILNKPRPTFQNIQNGTYVSFPDLIFEKDNGNMNS